MTGLPFEPMTVASPALTPSRLWPPVTPLTRPPAPVPPSTEVAVPVTPLRAPVTPFKPALAFALTPFWLTLAAALRVAPTPATVPPTAVVRPAVGRPRPRVPAVTFGTTDTLPSDPVTIAPTPPEPVRPPSRPPAPPEPPEPEPEPEPPEPEPPPPDPPPSDEPPPPEAPRPSPAAREKPWLDPQAATERRAAHAAPRISCLLICCREVMSISFHCF